MWVKIKDDIIHTTAWYKNHIGELFEVEKTTNLFSGSENDCYYLVKNNNKVLFSYIEISDADIVNPRREKLIKIKEKL